MKQDLEITPEKFFKVRRRFLKLGAGTLVSALMADNLLAAVLKEQELEFKEMNAQEAFALNGELLEATKEEIATSYNNFYEFGFFKTDPKNKAHSLKTSPWDIRIEGEIEEPFSISYTDLLSKVHLVERVYRFRCVEAWSMVIPWVGFELRELIELARPNANAKYVRFTTLYDPKQFPMQGIMQLLDFPYKEVLRLDEAMHPLTLLAVGMYKKPLPPQNGAPLRLVVPWKYGYKSIKSINKIEFLKDKPISTWEAENPKEYGFYGNVDPEVSHPRWSQKSERVIGKRGQIATLYLNGYASEVEHFYQGLDRTKLY
ncbi:protein-methionine-sulfoxide reductase catalytic subunit MsrP [Helicobacter turcicus]|uniref:Protein-methionine-sulfoxide reductase catalytic subunit MsrP n=1 Tax=Helicobacter turcicus TaxID=2867412 RepID=A0ABS7JMD6_9HELI|nr:protein-methionine-sulfoxide reductase catalytic subunit MsrP [Helicobacter turcicus]MBX7490551.1 protein-methionine-sulfoxide reductase catalytic subunit MsrP [Helicobacter turcicus]MBX7545539.1 protein-methionine-sulfoxide reductase catalytic subunit MsrP [Helicobacter turcicus]